MIGLTVFLGITGVAAGVGATFYQGSDTLYNVTTQALSASGSTLPLYIGGGSCAAEAAMSTSAPTQASGPMSRMFTGNVAGARLSCFDEQGVCGSTVTNASGIVVGLDAIDILASTSSGASAACTGGPDGGAGGLLFNGGSIVASNWKDVLALVYGGKDNKTGLVDCNQMSRINLVANWSQLFQDGCANGVATCKDANHTGAGAGTGIVSGIAPLWHAWRMDDGSGTAYVFASILDLSPLPLQYALNGFGVSPYCNAMNWDTSTIGCTCLSGGPFQPHQQFVGPGGVPDTNPSGAGHRMPPPGLNGLQVYGAAPDPSQTYKSQPIAFDVLPTDMQDNDPIRRACYGGGVRVLGKIGEDVCNIDGSLGLVLPLADTDFIAQLPDPVNTGSMLKQYPSSVSQACTGQFVAGTPPNVFSCAPAGITHPGECPNGDVLGSGECVYPIGTTFGQCTASNSTVSALITRTSAGNADGRVFNLFMTDGNMVNGGVGLAQRIVQEPVPASPLENTVDMAGAFNRIHQTDIAVVGATPCQMISMTDQIGCLAQADPCSLGFAGNGGASWNQAPREAPGAPPPPPTPGNGGIPVFNVSPQLNFVQKLGLAGEYPLARKLYLNSLVGFSALPTPDSTLAHFEASPSSGFDSILTNDGYFELGPQAGSVTTGTANAQFCEDFNEALVCGASTNVNACPNNPTGLIPNANTVCGNAVREPFEECDDGLHNGASGDPCSAICRCVTYLDPSTGNCH
jgi:cysteine-rich repeat protein